MRSALLVAVVAVLVLQSSSFWKAPPAAVRPGGGWVKLVKEDPSIEANFLSVEDEESLIASKLNEWRELKALGVLDKIDENVSEEDIEEMDILLNRKRRQSVKPVLNPSEKIAFDLQQKLKLVKDNPVALYSILNEMKDKNAHDYSLAKEILLNLARGSNTKLALSSIKLFVSWMEEEKFSEVCKPHELKRFGQHFGLICYTNPAMFSSLNEITSTLVDKGLVDHEESLSIGLVCKDLIDHLEIHNDKVSSLNSQRDEELLTILRPVTNNVKKFSVPELNWIIRVLGKYKQIPEIFDLLKLMRQNRLTPNSESLEFLTNALVVSVDPGTKAVTMKDLPASSTHKPEIVFIGRSNVGKSSLVNFLLNRKALASTSATPGHTQHFHFFSVNKDSKKLPEFTFVDVPGLGYAETVDEDQQQSWRSLLERYLSRRESLTLVCHLIDSRNKMTATDDEMIRMVARSSMERSKRSAGTFKYAIILTKVDKVKRKDLEATIKSVNSTIGDFLTDSSSTNGMEKSILDNVELLQTSSVSKVGADDLWRLIQEAILKD